MNRAHRITYAAGILIALVVALDPVLFDEWSRLPAFALLGVGLSHVIVLTLLGFFARPADLITVGSRVETAGYLHTLIGFAAALVVIGTASTGQEVQLAQVLLPLGAALTTSVLGWLFGGLLVEGAVVDEPGLESLTHGVVSDLDVMRVSLTQVHDRQMALLARVETLITDVNESAFSKVPSAAGALTSSIEELRGKIAQLSAGVRERFDEDFKEELDGFVAAFRQVAEKLTDASSQADAVARAGGEAAIHLQSAAKSSEEASEALKELPKSLRAHAKEMAASVEGMQERNREQSNALARARRASETTSKRSEELLTAMEQLTTRVKTLESTFDESFLDAVTRLQTGVTTTAGEFERSAEMAKELVLFLEQTTALFDRAVTVFESLPKE